MGQTLLVVRGWGGTPVERSSSCLLGRDTGEQGGCRGLQGAAGGLQGSPSKHHIPVLGWAVQLRGCAQWDTPLHPPAPRGPSSIAGAPGAVHR